MEWNGKNTAKMHIRLTEDVAREVRAIADLEHRPIQHQLRVFVVLGLQAYRSGVHANSGIERRTSGLDAAQGGMRNDLQLSPAPPHAANRRTVTQERKRA